MAGPIRISILADARNAINGLQQTGRAADDAGKRTSKMGSLFKSSFAMVGGAIAGVGIVSGIKAIVGQAADLQAAMGANSQIFGKSAKSVQDWSKNAATAFGLSRAEALKATQQFGSAFTGMGMGAEKAAQLSKSWVEMSANMAAFGDIPTTEVTDMISSALRGEYDSLQRLVPSINAAKIEQRAMEQTGKKNAKALTDQDKAMAINSILMDSNANKAGKAERAQGGYGVQMEKMKAQFKDIAANIGSKFLPALTKIAQWVNDKLVPAIKEFWSTHGPKFNQAFQSAVGFIKGLWSALQNPALQAFIVGIGAIVVAMKAYQAYVLIVSTVTKAWAAVQAILNVVMAMNPIGLVVLAIVGLVAALVFAWKRSETFRKVVIGVWNAIKAATVAVFNFLKPFIMAVWNGIKVYFTTIFKVYKAIFTGFIIGVKAIWSGIKWLWTFAVGIFNSVKSAISTALSTVKGYVSTAISRIKSAWNGITVLYTKAKSAVDNAVNYVKGLPGKAISAIGNIASKFASIGSDIVNGIKNGIINAWDSFTSWLAGKMASLPGPLKTVLGIGSPSKVFAKQIGLPMVQGIVAGFESISAKDMLRDFMRDVSHMEVPSIGIGATGTAWAGAAGGAVAPVTVNVQMGIVGDPAEAGRQVRKVLDEYSKRYGR